MKGSAFLAVVAVAIGLTVGPVSAGTTLADIEAAANAAADELTKIDDLLNSEDRNKAIGAMIAMIGSGNPVFVLRAKQAGLTSSEPELRAIALKAVLDAGGPFRLDVEVSEATEEKTRIAEWLGKLGGSFDPAQSKGSYVFSLGPYAEKARCWPFLNANNCAIYLAGETVSLQDWRYAAGELTLGSDGRLVGTFLTRFSSQGGRPVAASINLLE